MSEAYLTHSRQNQQDGKAGLMEKLGAKLVRVLTGQQNHSLKVIFTSGQK